MGLLITKRLIELQGGQLKVDSRLKKGTEFSFFLRYAIGNQENIDMNMQFSGQFNNLKNISILVVEDNQINQLVTRKYLEKWEAQFEIVDNGLKAYNIVKVRDFDIVLMDIQMPVMDGYEATQHIRALPEEKYKKLPVIALTGSVMLEIQKKITASGMDDFLLKPFNPMTCMLKFLSM